MTIDTVKRPTSQDGTLGHSSICGGLRGHSIGDTYPITVIAVGVNPTLWAAHDTRTGKLGTLQNSAHIAYEDARFYSLLGAIE